MSPRISLRLLSAQSDQRLLELVAAGHERAFEAIVNRYRKPLLAYCARVGISDARAEDVLQQALLKAWIALAAGTEVRELRPWLYRIVHNTALNVLRGVVEQPEQGESMAVAQPADAEVERRLEARTALSHVAALPDMQRDVILLSALDGRSHEEVASALGISSGAVRGLLYRARSALRSAAAAFTPPSLVQWAMGRGGAAPTAARLAEISSAGGGDSGAALLKAAALAATAALAAGAALGPLRGHADRHPAGGSGSGGSGVQRTRLAAGRGASSGTARTLSGRSGGATSSSSQLGRPGSSGLQPVATLAPVSHNLSHATPRSSRGGGSTPAEGGTEQASPAAPTSSSAQAATVASAPSSGGSTGTTTTTTTPSPPTVKTEETAPPPPTIEPEKPVEKVTDDPPSEKSDDPETPPGEVGGTEKTDDGTGGTTKDS